MNGLIDRGIPVGDGRVAKDEYYRTYSLIAAASDNLSLKEIEQAVEANILANKESYTWIEPIDPIAMYMKDNQR